MKKLIAIAALAAFALPSWAAPAEPEVVTVEDVAEDLATDDNGGLAVKVDAPRKNVALWPAFIAIWDFPETPDLVGLRITVPCSTKQENVTGFDVGLWGGIPAPASRSAATTPSRAATFSASRSASGTSR